MSNTLKTVLTWAEVVASVILITVPAIRNIDTQIDNAKVEIALLHKEEE